MCNSGAESTAGVSVTGGGQRKQRSNQFQMSFVMLFISVAGDAFK